MFRRKIDGVIEAVRYAEDESIDWVRFYERRGFIYSDRLLLSRDELLDRLESGHLFFTGKRTQYQGNVFNTDKKVIAKKKNGKTVILTEDSDAEHDHLTGVPRI